MTSGAMYPGVPEVSFEFSGCQILAMPKSVILMYPLLSNTRFSGFMSQWIIPLLWTISRPTTILATKNLTYSSENLLCLEIWYLRSPPPRRSITR